MRIKRRHLRKLIREAITIVEGYDVPRFSNSASMEDWLEELIDSDVEAEVDSDVMDPETGEVWVPAGESVVDQEWWEDHDAYADWADLKKSEDPPEEEEEEFDWEADERTREEELRARRKLDDQMQEKISQQAMEGGKDWGSDTLYQARENPSMWKDGSSYQQHDSPEDYVLAFGQDAAGDVAQSLEYTFDSNDMYDWYDSLPIREPAYYSDDAGRPTKQTMKDIYADNFYDGVSQAVKEAKAAA